MLACPSFLLRLAVPQIAVNACISVRSIEVLTDESTLTIFAAVGALTVLYQRFNGAVFENVRHFVFLDDLAVWMTIHVEIIVMRRLLHLMLESGVWHLLIFFVFFGIRIELLSHSRQAAFEVIVIKAALFQSVFIPDHRTGR